MSQFIDLNSIRIDQWYSPWQNNGLHTLKKLLQSVDLLSLIRIENLRSTKDYHNKTTIRLIFLKRNHFLLNLKIVLNIHNVYCQR